jgi:hypothetical protein
MGGQRGQAAPIDVNRTHRTKYMRVERARRTPILRAEASRRNDYDEHVDKAVWEASSPREKVLLYGLSDWVALDDVHSYVQLANPGAPLTAIQDETLGLIRELAEEGLCLLGDLTGDGGRFQAWNTSVEDSLDRIRGEYVDRYHVDNHWPWYCWLELTAEGNRVAEAIEAKLNQLSP